MTAPCRNVRAFAELAREKLGEQAANFLNGGADDERTLRRNESDFAHLGIRCRRLVDVRVIDTRVTLLGTALPHPILAAPIGYQSLFHPGAEPETARGLAAAGALMIASSVSDRAYAEVAQAIREAPVGGRAPAAMATTAPADAMATAANPMPWFQCYPTIDREITAKMLERAESAGCEVVVLTVDIPLLGNREAHADHVHRLEAGEGGLGNYRGIRTTESILDASLTWEMVPWLRKHCGMKVVLKGIVTAEDAALCVEQGVDGVIVSNHGGRQEESNRSSIACLGEVADAIEAAEGVSKRGGERPRTRRTAVLLDGGIRRGTDIFKALALGADAICIGRPVIWGVAAEGAAGVQRVIDLLRRELVLTMQLAGTTSLPAITPERVERLWCKCNAKA